MNTLKALPKIVLFFALLWINSTLFAYLHPAELRIVNDSQRQFTVKVMKETGEKYATVSIDSNSSKTIEIDQTGNYYLKTKAVYPGKRPIFKKGDPFKVYVGSDGYSVLTITFSIKETALPDPMSGEQISETEFEKDQD